MNIPEALQQLDPNDESQWTEGGLPRVEVLQTLLGRQISRKEITDAAPHFTRENPDLSATTEMAIDEDPEVSLAQANKEVDEANQAAAEANKRLMEARAKADEAIMKKEGTQEPDHIRNMRNIRHFLDQQHKNRMARVAKQKEILAAIPTEDLKTLGGRSPLDQALARRNPRDTVHTIPLTPAQEK